jgi:hypothetical protein
MSTHFVDVWSEALTDVICRYLDESSIVNIKSVSARSYFVDPPGGSGNTATL